MSAMLIRLDSHLTVNNLQHYAETLELGVCYKEKLRVHFIHTLFVFCVCLLHLQLIFVLASVFVFFR